MIIPNYRDLKTKVQYSSMELSKNGNSFFYLKAYLCFLKTLVFLKKFYLFLYSYRKYLLLVNP